MVLLKHLKRVFPQPSRPTIEGLYRACVIQTRNPLFYQSLQVPDTVDGRFDLLLLHVFLLMRRLGSEQAAKQALFDLMFADMDVNLREMGVGDMSVGKKIKPMIAAFYGRSQAYEGALAEDDAALGVALQRNLYGTTPIVPEIIDQTVGYVRSSVIKLEKQSVNDLLCGKVEFAAFGEKYETENDHRRA